MLLLFFSDLHLETFGHTFDNMRDRRRIVREAFGRICDLAIDVRADAVCCGGDLYEQESIESDTGDVLREGFARLDPMPVFIAPGDHDPWGPDSLYARVGWTPNVRIFTDPELRPTRLNDDLTIWGAAHRWPPHEGGFLDTFWARGDGIHVALFHGTERSCSPGYARCGEAIAPFSAHQIPQAGLHHALVGHAHDPHDADDYTYAGNPAPLEADQTVQDGVVLVTIRSSGSVHRQRRTVAAAVDHVPTFVGPTSSLPVIGGPAREAPGPDRDAIARERTVRGQFVRDVRAATELSDADRERVLDMGLRALAGSTDLEVR